MIVIVDRPARARSTLLRGKFLAAGVPCALCTPETLPATGGAPVTVCFAANESEITRVSLRAGKTALFAVNVSGRRMYHPDAVILDDANRDEIVALALKAAAERADLDRIVAGDVRIERGAVYFRHRYAVLTEAERLILIHLALRADVFCAEREIRKFVCASGDLRRSRSSVSVHVAHMNSKSLRAAGVKVVTCRRGHGYAILTSPPAAPNRAGKPGFVPPFS